MTKMALLMGWATIDSPKATLTRETTIVAVGYIGIQN